MRFDLWGGVVIGFTSSCPHIGEFGSPSACTIARKLSDRQRLAPTALDECAASGGKPAPQASFFENRTAAIRAGRQPQTIGRAPARSAPCALVGFSASITIMTIMSDTNGGGIDMASDNGVIGVSGAPVSRGGVAGPITITVSRVALAGPIAVGRGVAVRSVAETCPITIAVSRVAVAGPITIAVR
jgi:hypothetical protein